MKILFSALVLMMSLSTFGCSNDDTTGVVTTGDVEVEDVQADVVDDATVSDTVDSTEDVAIVEEGD